MEAQDYLTFQLLFGDCHQQMMARVFPNLYEELILGIPGLKKEKPQIDRRQRQVKEERILQALQLPFHH